MSAKTPASPAWPRRAFVLLLVAYPPLLAASLLLHRAALSAAAGLVLVSLLTWPGLVAGRRVAWALWFAAVGIGAWLAWRGHAALGLMLLPVAINAAVAWLFASTLAAGSEPLIARAIVAIEGEERLAQPGVAAYARALTIAWAVLLGAQALALAAGAVLAVPGGMLALAGVASPWPLPADLVVGYGHGGGYLVVGTFFLLEFAWRHWRLRHLPHPGPREFFGNLARNWPRLLSAGTRRGSAQQ
jgi:hypothetical protein